MNGTNSNFTQPHVRYLFPSNRQARKLSGGFLIGYLAFVAAVFSVPQCPLMADSTRTTGVEFLVAAMRQHRCNGASGHYAALRGFYKAAISTAASL
jgi:hypothetical protein